MMRSLLESSDGSSMSTIENSMSIIKLIVLNDICMVASPITLVFLLYLPCLPLVFLLELYALTSSTMPGIEAFPLRT